MSPPKTRYGSRRSQYAELTLPGGDGPFPTAVVVHGGFWKSGYGRRQMWPLCEDLVGRGWATYNVEYRRLGRGSGGGWPATCEDVLSAYDHLAERHDVTRAVAVGHSAGGHLATWLAAHRPLRGVVAQAGVLDLVHAQALGLSRGTVGRFLGGDAADFPEASPAALVPIAAPVLCVHGSEDDAVPLSISERFAAAQRTAGGACELDVFPGEGHMGHIDPANPMWAAARKWMHAAVA